MKVEIKDPVAIYCDNTSAINISKNPIMHTKTKHIAIKYHFLRELVQDKEVRLEYVNTKEQIVDIFTKPLSYALNLTRQNTTHCYKISFFKRIGTG